MFMRCRPLAADGVTLIPTRGAAHRQLKLQPATEWLEVLVQVSEDDSREANRYAGLLESARRENIETLASQVGGQASLLQSLADA
jgi:hypothetical protein